MRKNAIGNLFLDTLCVSYSRGWLRVFFKKIENSYGIVKTTIISNTERQFMEMYQVIRYFLNEMEKRFGMPC